MFSDSGLVEGGVLLVHRSMGRTFKRERCGPKKMLDLPYRYQKDLTAPYTGRDGATAPRTFYIFVRDIGKGLLTGVGRMGERVCAIGLYKAQRPGTGHGMRTIKARICSMAPPLSSSPAQPGRFCVTSSDRATIAAPFGEDAGAWCHEFEGRL